MGGQYIFVILSSDGEISRKTRDEWITTVTKGRVSHADKSSEPRRQVDEKKIHICGKHFECSLVEIQVNILPIDELLVSKETIYTTYMVIYRVIEVIRSRRP